MKEGRPVQKRTKENKNERKSYDDMPLTASELKADDLEKYHPFTKAMVNH